MHHLKLPALLLATCLSFTVFTAAANAASGYTPQTKFSRSITIPNSARKQFSTNDDSGNSHMSRNARRNAAREARRNRGQNQPQQDANDNDGERTQSEDKLDGNNGQHGRRMNARAAKTRNGGAEGLNAKSGLND